MVNLQIIQRNHFIIHNPLKVRKGVWIKSDLIPDYIDDIRYIVSSIWSGSKRFSTIFRIEFGEEKTEASEYFLWGLYYWRIPELT